MKLFTTLAGMVHYVSQHYAKEHAFNRRVNGVWQSLSTEQFVARVRSISLGLRHLGIKRGDTVGIQAQPSPDWLVFDLAIMACGGVTVPIFTHISEKNFLFEVENSDMNTLFVHGEEVWNSLSDQKFRLKNLITSEIGGDSAHQWDEAERVFDLDEIIKLGDALGKRDPGLFERMIEEVKEDDLATIVYTSGSTGIPKGVELTHKNMVSQIEAGRLCHRWDTGSSRALSVLPLAHIFERTVMFAYVASGIDVYFCDDAKKVGEYAKQVRPTHSAMVPLLLEKIQTAMLQKINSASGLRRVIGRWAFRLANRPVGGLWNRFCRFIAEKLVYRKMREALGGCYNTVMTGGAALKKELNEFYLNIGIPVYQGYGQTESAPVITANNWRENCPGSVGKPFFNVEVRLSENGEILARGPSIMRGYHRNPEATNWVLKDGWLYTGDLGMFNEQGFLIVTGRLKEIFKTSTGKMVAPVPIESKLTELHLIDHAMLIGDEHKFVTALLFPNFDEVHLLQQKLRLTHLSLEDFLNSGYVKNLVRSLISKVNADLNEWEKVRDYRFVTEPLSIRKGELTPTLKISRRTVAKNYNELIESMYQT